MFHLNYKTWVPFFTVLVCFIASLLVIPQTNNALSLENESSPSSSQQSNYFAALEFISGCPQQDHSIAEEYDLGQHHCCASICLLKVPCGQSVTIKGAFSTTLALITEDKVGKAIVRSKTLFRPPIV